MAIYFHIYLIMFGCDIGLAAKGEAGMMLAFAPFYLAIDFLSRFIVQTTPGMMVKPYILQPISRYTAIECFLINAHVSGYNFLWLCMFVPYSIILLFGGESFGLVLLELITCEVLICACEQVAEERVAFCFKGHWVDGHGTRLGHPLPCLSDVSDNS